MAGAEDLDGEGVQARLVADELHRVALCATLIGPVTAGVTQGQAALHGHEGVGGLGG